MAPRLDERGARAEAGNFGEWFHNLHLPGGIETAPHHPLGDFPRRVWDRLAGCLPPDLGGWRVLDIGCNAGFYSFALAARGADVTGIDVDDRYLDQARWASGHLPRQNLPRFLRMSVYELPGNEALAGSFDLVWFMGVAYHLRHPLLALDIVRTLEPRFLMFQTMQFPDAQTPPVPENFPLSERERIAAKGWPKLGFIEHRLADDPTNWWVANEACTEALLRSSGFEVLDRPANETCWCRSAAVPDAARLELDSILRS